jgi:hypothetical protein
MNILSSLYSVIRGNNESILESLRAVGMESAKDFGKIRLRKDQINRLKMGLYYY